MLTQGPTPDPKCKYFIILYIATFIRLSHLYQQFYAHYIGIRNGGGMD